MNWTPNHFNVNYLSDSSTDVDSNIVSIDEWSDLSDNETPGNIYHHTDLVFYSLDFLKQVDNIFSAIIFRDLQYEEGTSNPPNWPWFAYPVKLSNRRTGLNQKEQASALGQLKKLEMIQVKYEGNPKKRYIMLL